MIQASIEDIITSTFIGYEGIIVFFIRVEFRSTNTGGKKDVCTWLYAIFVRLINNLSSLNKGNYDRNGV